MRKLKNEELGRISPEEFKGVKKLPVCLILDGIRSLYNVGSAFRTADAFRVEKIYLCGVTGTPPHREIHKTALGATEIVEWVYEQSVLDLANKLKEEGYLITCIEQADRSTSLLGFHPDPQKKYALVFGNEVFGVSKEVMQMADLVLEIPQFGTKHSLNISVSVGVVLWDFVSKLGII